MFSLLLDKFGRGSSKRGVVAGDETNIKAVSAYLAADTADRFRLRKTLVRLRSHTRRREHGKNSAKNFCCVEGSPLCRRVNGIFSRGW